ncbi:MAG: hypothetical protein ACO1SX_03940 [Actinomycetota bacterium]
MKFRARRNLDDFPEEYGRRLAAHYSGCRRALLALTVLSALAAGVVSRAIFGGGSASDGAFPLLAGALGAALLLFAWVVLLGSFVDPLVAQPRIVPYFRAAVPGPDTFFGGEALARHCRALDRIAAQLGVDGISTYGFADEFRGESACWRPAADGLVTFRALRERLLTEPGVLSDPDPVIAELQRMEEKLGEAARLDVQFCLHLRADTAYSGQEFDSRQGRYW